MDGGCPGRGRGYMLQGRYVLGGGSSVRRVIPALLVFLTATTAQANDSESSAERGKKALYGRAFTPATWSLSSFDNAWKHWDHKPDQPPKDYLAAFREYYGLAEAPFENGRYPLGLRE